MNIERNRWIMTRNKETEIFCGLARHYQFKSIYDLGDTAIKTYLSKDKAIAAFEKSWGKYDNNLYQAVEVIEIISTDIMRYGT